jgi:hypothetical protein
MIVTRIVKSKNLNQGKYQKLLEQAKRLGQYPQRSLALLMVQ